ncbi:hypothetical protein IKF81_01780, partial [Candidatus Saccharibacteria bacterium]|nr:hypothetical protein [Candidatus Saccharibacteria bacterium]
MALNLCSPRLAIRFGNSLADFARHGRQFIARFQFVKPRLSASLWYLLAGDKSGKEVLKGLAYFSFVSGKD